ncbi:hypothetical protein ACFFIS_12485 [Virgibacillus soli]|uniref:Secreted protein n=1 Tax=Paracerasibacillus soli TaxID=480284 RepID=A0ABU5CPZ4_9BACI|nr:hypothetical protein [Virgibacillus soli]MDY0407894.1 hypothetical protein [Virgibacillus soli]
MRKYLGAMLVFSLLLFGTPLTIGASTNGEDVEAAQSRTITVYKQYSLGTIPPKYITHNTNGWTGRLTLQGYQSTGDFILAIYRGVVSCSGTCPIAPAQGQNK